MLVRISFTACAAGTVCLPLIGLIICIVISALYHYKDSTRTHCQVENYLPSISASIGLCPECHIWRICIGLHSAPRFIVAYSYFKFYKLCFANRGTETTLAYINLGFAIIETLGLLMLTYVSSTDIYSLHEVGFILFALGSFIHMVITCHLWKAIKSYSVNPADAKSHLWKVRLFLLNLCFSVFAGFFYIQHNLYCEVGSYTLFALFEYLIVFSNMGFHFTAVWDFRSHGIIIACGL
ncbi:acyltransferase PGAP2-like [Stigmatopora nigra]